MAMVQGKRASALFRWYPDHEHTVYADVYNAFKKQLTLAVLDNPEGVTLPLNLGWLKVVGIKTSTVDINKMRAVWPTREERAAIPYKLRYDSRPCEGRLFVVRWYSQTVGQVEDNSSRAFFNSDIYAFKSNNHMRKALRGRVVEDKWSDFHFESTFKAPRIKEGRGRPKKVKIEEPVEPVELLDPLDHFEELTDSDEQ